jgi:hypothetical protein
LNFDARVSFKVVKAVYVTSNSVADYPAPRMTTVYSIYIPLLQIPIMSQFENKKGRWTQDEDELLRVAMRGLKGKPYWRDIAQIVKGRTAIQCLHRWNKVLKPGLVKGNWTSEEDQELINWVQIHGPTKWAKCGAKIVTRNGKQCFDRWTNSLDPNIKKGDWDADENSLIFSLYGQFGPKWADISKLMPGRTENSVKNRFYSTVRRMQRLNEKVLSVENPLQPMVDMLARQTLHLQDTEVPHEKPRGLFRDIVNLP